VKIPGFQPILLQILRLLKVGILIVKSYHNYRYVFIVPYIELGFYLKGTFYPPNVALDLTDIGVDVDSLICVTPLILCCKGVDNPYGGFQGAWKFPDGSEVGHRDYNYGIFRTRGPGAVLLHRNSNVMSPAGVYTCEIPDRRNLTIRELNVL